MGYHLRKIEKGELGKFSKVVEEFEEFLDALEQHNYIMALVELSDMYGAIEHYKKSWSSFPKNRSCSWPILSSEPEIAMQHIMQHLKKNPTDENKLLHLEFKMQRYLTKYNMTLEDLKIMNAATERAFKTGRR